MMFAQQKLQIRFSRKLLATTFLLASLFSSNSFAQEKEPDLFSFCSRFPLNSKCKELGKPILLKERKGILAICQYALGDYRKNAKCKIDFVEGNLVVYQEIGARIEKLDNQRLTLENTIDRDRLLIYNGQIWNTINRWEITYLSKSKNQENIMNSLIILGRSPLSQAIYQNIPNLKIHQSQKRLSQAQDANSNNNSSSTTQLLKTKECVGCDLSNANLANLDLKDVNLSGANLQGTDLTKSNLENAYLVGADLSGANLANANLGGANLTLAKLNNTSLINTDLQAANFQGADLQKANLTSAYLRAPTFLKEANLTEANLTRADLRGANFLQANLTRANLTDANLKDTHVKLKGVPNNYNADKRAIDQFIRFPVFAISSLTTSGEVDFKTNLDQANLEGANFQGSSLEEVSITNANLTNANFSNSKIEKTNLEQATLCNTTMPDQDIQNRDC